MAESEELIERLGKEFYISPKQTCRLNIDFQLIKKLPYPKQGLASNRG